MEARSGKRTNIRFVFDTPPLVLPFPKKTNNKKNDDGSFSFGNALLALSKSGGGRWIFLWVVLLLHHQRWQLLHLRSQGGEGEEGGPLIHTGCRFFFVS